MSTINKVGHGFVGGERIVLSSLVGGVPLDPDFVYFVLAAGITANTFSISETDGGSALTFTTITSANMTTVPETTDTDTYPAGTYTAVSDPADVQAPPVALAAPGSCVLSSATNLAADGTVFTRLTITIVQPASATLRHTIVTVTGGSETFLVIIPAGQTVASWVPVRPGITYTGSAVAFDTFGLASTATVSAGHVAVGDSTAPSQVTGLTASGGIRGANVSWTPSTATDLAYYELQVDTSAGFGTATTHKVKVSTLTLSEMATGTWFFRVRAVDLSGNLGTYSSTQSAVSRLVTGGSDILANSITANDILASSISADRLVIGSFPARNLCPNGGFRNALTGWTFNVNGAGGSPAASMWGASATDWTLADGDVDGWVPVGGPYGSTAFMNGTSALGAFEPYLVSTNGIPVTGGEYYSMSALLGVHRLTGARAAVWFYDSAGAFITGPNSTIADVSKNGGTSKTGYSYVTVNGFQAPSNAVSAKIVLIATGPVTSGVDWYLFMDQVWFGLGKAARGYDAAEANAVRNSDGNVLIDANGVTINNGKLTFKDEFGATVVQAAGFSSNWLDFISMGLYNARFLAGVAGVIPAGRSSSLPYWTLTKTTGTPTGTFVASGGGVEITFNALNDVLTLTSDAIGVRPRVFYYVPSSVSSTKVSATMFLLYDVFVDWFKADGTASATVTTQLSPSVSFSGTVSDVNVNVFNPVQAPADARSAKVRVQVTESNIGSHNAGNKLTMKAIGLREVTQREIGGIAFPASPQLDDRFFRQDFELEFFFDGTRWLSVEEYVAIPNIHNTLPPLAATAAGNGYAVLNPRGGSDIYVTDVVTNINVAAGGTALGASHKWVATIQKADTSGSTTFVTSTWASGASSAWRQDRQTFNGLLGSTMTNIRVDWTKTGTPGNLNYAIAVYYRIVAT